MQGFQAPKLSYQMHRLFHQKVQLFFHHRSLILRKHLSNTVCIRHWSSSSWIKAYHEDHTTLVVDSFPFFTRSVLEHVWWPTIQTDDLLYHTILLLNSLHLEKLQKGLSAWRSQTKELMRECISILRSRIDDGSVPIETIMSVAILASIAVRTLMLL